MHVGVSKVRIVRAVEASGPAGDPEFEAAYPGSAEAVQ